MTSGSGCCSLRGATALLPQYSGGRVRAAVLRLAGFRIGRGVVISQTPKMYGGSDLTRLLSIGEHTYINVGCHFELFDRIDIGDNVAMGHEVMLLTTTHEMGPPERRAGPRIHGPVRIGSGAVDRGACRHPAVGHGRRRRRGRGRRGRRPRRCGGFGRRRRAGARGVVVRCGRGSGRGTAARLRRRSDAGRVHAPARERAPREVDVHARKRELHPRAPLRSDAPRARRPRLSCSLSAPG